MSSLLEQAIVDAKALRDVAYESAKDALVEKYASQIKEAVDSILEQDPEPEDAGMGDLEQSLMTGQLPVDHGADEPSNLDIPMAATDGEKLCQCPDEDEEIEIDFDELEKQMSSEEEPEMSHDQLAAEMPGEPASAPGLPGGLQGELGDEEDVDIREEDLMSLLQEEDSCGDDLALKETDVAESDDPTLEESDDVEEAVKLSDKYKSDVAAAKKKKAEREKEKQDSPEQLEESLVNYITKTIKEETQRLELGFNAKASKLIEENKTLQKDFQEVVKENNNLKEKLVEVSKTLSEVNLNNAKFFYSNKVLKSASLNERQKTKIVEAVSRAGSVEDAKTIFETLSDSMGSVKQQSKSLSEVLSKKSGFASQHKTKDESPIETIRWQALAGIKK